MISDYVTSIVRTLVPSLVATAVTWIGIHWHIAIDSATSTTVVTLITFLIGSVYYMGARALEAKYPQAGVMLGIPKRPVYVAPGPPDVLPEVVEARDEIEEEGK